MDTPNTSLVDEAIIFAAKAHSGQLRKGQKIPYIVHPMEALAITSTMTDDYELLAASVLHDVVEDTPATIEDIRQSFGDNVARLVQAETAKRSEKTSRTDSWKETKQYTLDHLKAASHDVKIVAMADKLANMRAIARDYAQLGDALWQRFKVTDMRLHAWYYHGLLEALRDLDGTPPYREFAFLFNKVFQKALATE